jgi:hypothetical protein
MRTYKIYCLWCPVAEEIKYVGQTSVSLSQRLSGHLSERTNTVKSLWIQSLLKEGKRPGMFTIDQTNNLSEANFLEEYWQCQLKSWNFNLLSIGNFKPVSNVTAGKVKIPNETRLRWLAMKEWGDINKLAELTGLTASQTNQILLSGRGLPKYLTIVKKFYANRAELIKALAND